jgi:type I restriction enzyme M protein
VGAIIGDIVGSRFEFNNIKTKEFEFFHERCKFTDDSVMSLAVAKALMDCGEDYDKLGAKAIESMRELGEAYPGRGYGGMFRKWLHADYPAPYNSFGNGAAMRVSACAFVANSIEEAIQLTRKVTEVTHNHPEGIKGAEATVVCAFLARTGRGIREIRDYINERYYQMNFMLDDIRDGYQFCDTCQGTVPQAIAAFLESISYEDSIRGAVSLGGDSDTLAAITGGIAEAFYGAPTDICIQAQTFLDERLSRIVNDFERAFPPR